MTRLYKVTGNIRGECGHNHRSVRRAAICRNRDFVGCARQGGYSDRSKLEVSEGGVIVEPTAAELEQFEQVLYSLTYGGAR